MHTCLYDLQDDKVVVVNTVQVKEKDEQGNAILVAIDTLELPAFAHGRKESEEQLVAAKTAAKALYKSSALGTSSRGLTLSASLSGHANPDHEATTGWSLDMIHISVSRVYLTTDA